MFRPAAARVALSVGSAAPGAMAFPASVSGAFPATSGGGGGGSSGGGGGGSGGGSGERGGGTPPGNLQALVDAWCRDSGRPLYGPDPGHVCTRSCTVLGVWPHQVCAESRLEHHCGGRRACRFLASTGEGTVCTFSGRVLEGVADTVPAAGDPHWGHVRVPRPPPRRFVPPPRCAR